METFTYSWQFEAVRLCRILLISVIKPNPCQEYVNVPIVSPGVGLTMIFRCNDNNGGRSNRAATMRVMMVIFNVSDYLAEYKRLRGNYGIIFSAK